MSDTSDLRIFYRGSGVISSISIDWLYQRLYFIMDKLVSLSAYNYLSILTSMFGGKHNFVSLITYFRS